MKNSLVKSVLLSSFLLLPLTGEASSELVLNIQNGFEQSVDSNYLGLAANPTGLKPLSVALPEATIIGLNRASADFATTLKTPAGSQTYVSATLAQRDELSSSSRSVYRGLANFINDEIAPLLKNSEPQDAVFNLNDDVVTDFNPGTYGLSFDLLEIASQVISAARLNQTEVTVNPVKIAPQKALAEVNPYGITSLISAGTSDFGGSSRNRVTNIRVGSSRYHGRLIAPNETFSFNDLLGPVDGEHGFTPELVIKSTGLVPEFGGGICQVSSTVFRAAINAGLPIDQRRNHSFAVSYYAPQGTDATIYPGSQDLKFTNDTGRHILIWTGISGAKLTFSFYGQPDGRQVSVTYPVRFNQKSSGAFSASFSRVVVSASGERKDTFSSFYRPKEDFVQTTTAAEPPPAENTTPPPAPPEETAPESPPEPDAAESNATNI